MADPNELEYWLIIAVGFTGFTLVCVGCFVMKRDYELRNLADMVIVIGSILSFVATNWGFHYIAPS